MDLKIEKILCAIDFSEFSRGVIDYAAALAKTFNARLLIFHSIRSGEDAMFDTDIATLARDTPDRKIEAEAKIAGLMARTSVAWEPLVTFGDSVDQAAPLVDGGDIDLVVAASYGLTGLKRLLLGTIVERMARSLKCPMIVIPGRRRRKSHPVEPFSGISKIVVSCDFSPESVLALRYAYQFGLAWNAELHLLHAVEAPVAEHIVEPTEGPYEKVQQELQHQLNMRLGDLLPPTSPVPIRTGLLQGLPGEQVPAYAQGEHADLIAVGVHPQSRFQKVFKGSTTEALLRRSPCPVLVVPSDLPGKRTWSLPATRAVARTGIVMDKRFLDHITDEGHPEAPGRLKAVYDRLDAGGTMDHLIRIVPKPAAREDMLMVHSAEYLDKIAATAGKAHTALTPDTHASAESYPVALLAVGGIFEAIRQVHQGTVRNAFALIRPPGHHAEKSRALGYCLFNNVALGTKFAMNRLGLERILIVDWDVHHGNGTQHIFEGSRNVLFFSTHQYPHFPKTGYFTETGIGEGEGFTINIPLPKGYGDGEYITIFKRLLRPVAFQFNPDMILVSAGFDIHPRDPLGAMRVSPAGFAALTRCLMEMADICCEGRLVLALEGGYDRAAVAESVPAVLDELSDKTRTDPSILERSADPKKIRYILSRSIPVYQPFWNSIGRREDHL
jgi:acetoin utilization deacetylase AcuC-like enzyme/nucleotide-binding universal stress UspA family protein